jgi:hypothetical protein
VTPSPNIWIGNIDSNIPEHEIRSAFERFGAIERIKMLPQKNCAFVNFVELSSALAAKAEMNGYMFFGQPLKVNFGKPRQPGYRDSGGADGYGGGAGSGPSSGPGYSRDSHYRQEERPSSSASYPSGPRGEAGDSSQSAAPEAVSIPVSEPMNVSEEVKATANKLVEAFSKNPDLEAMTKQNNLNNPKFSFLFPGREGHEYYLWKRYGSQVVASAEAATGAGRSAPFVPKLPEGAEPLSANEVEDFEGMLRTLDPSKEKIKAAADFAGEHAQKAPAIALALFDFAFNKITPSQNVLHFIYLINEIFNVTLRAKSATETESDSPVLKLSSAFVPHLARLMNAANTEENKKVLVGILNRWKETQALSEQELFSISADFDASDSKKRKREDADPADETVAKRPLPSSE